MDAAALAGFCFFGFGAKKSFIVVDCFAAAAFLAGAMIGICVGARPRVFALARSLELLSWLRELLSLEIELVGRFQTLDASSGRGAGASTYARRRRSPPEITCNLR